MVYSAVTAFADCLSSKILLTAILKGGCNLGCPFCIVSARSERQEQSDVRAGHVITILKKEVMGSNTGADLCFIHFLP